MCFKFIIAGCCMALSVRVCAQNVMPVDSNYYISIRIDPANAMGGTVSDVFREVEYIPLETTAESLFGRVSQLEIMNGYYIILDHDKNAIFIFTAAGKFHAKIKGKPNVRLFNFLVNKWTNQIIFSNDNYQSMTYCDIDGKVIKNEKNWLPNEGPVIYLFTHFTSPDQLISFFPYRDIDPSAKDYRSYSRSLLRFGRPVLSTGMPYTAKEGKVDVTTSGIGPLTAFGKDTTFFFAKPYDYNIYTVTPHNIQLTYKFIFPQQLSLPPDFLTNPAYDLKRINFVNRNKGLIFCLSNCYQMGSNLFFQVNSASTTQESNLLYNLKSGDVVAFKHILPDAMSYYLPVYDNSSSQFDNLGFLFCDGTAVYTSLSSLIMFKAKAENKEKVEWPDRLKRYFDKGSAKDNPVIVRLKVKEEL